METLKYPLTNGQMELMRLFSRNLSENDLAELKQHLVRFFAERATKAANGIWDSRGLTNEDMDRILNEQD